jgi:hypothetical protein
MLYLHETVDVHPGLVEEFGPSLKAHYRPPMEASGARFVALWETVSICLPWPRFVCLWEVDGIGAVNDLLKTQQTTRGEDFRRWRRELGRLATRVEGRMLTPSASSLTAAQLRAGGPPLNTVVHEWIEVPQNQGENYCKQLEARYAPYAGIFNRQFVGTYHEVWNNKEAINIWTLPDEFTVFPGGEITANNLTASTEIESWIVMSVGLREGFHSGLLRLVDLDAG